MLLSLFCLLQQRIRNIIKNRNEFDLYFHLFSINFHSHFLEAKYISNEIEANDVGGAQKVMGGGGWGMGMQNVYVILIGISEVTRFF